MSNPNSGAEANALIADPVISGLYTQIAVCNSNITFLTSGNGIAQVQNQLAAQQAQLTAQQATLATQQAALLAAMTADLEAFNSAWRRQRGTDDLNPAADNPNASDEAAAIIADSNVMALYAQIAATQQQITFLSGSNGIAQTQALVASMQAQLTAANANLADMQNQLIAAMVGVLDNFSSLRILVTEVNRRERESLDAVASISTASPTPAPTPKKKLGLRPVDPVADVLARKQPPHPLGMQLATKPMVYRRSKGGVTVSTQ